MPADVAGPEVPADSGAAIFQRMDLCISPYSKNEHARRLLWGMTWSILFRPSPRWAFGWRNMLLRWFGAKVKRTARIRPTCHIFHPWLLEIGEWVGLSDFVNVYNLGPIRIGDHSAISQGVHLCAGTHDYTKPELPLVRSAIEIGAGVWIAAEAFIGPGVTIGDNAVIGARAVVVSDIPPNVVAAGNPARPIKPRLSS
jgi:putative colanic acid biosynthesis acetyltransferase WcaF